MKGYFSEETLKQFAALAEEKFGIDFSERNTYDFTRCVRSDGSFYGAGGKCRKGSEVDPKSLPTRQLKTLANRPELDAKQKAAVVKELSTRKKAELRPVSERGRTKSLAEQEAENKKLKEESEKLKAKGGYAPKDRTDGAEPPKLLNSTDLGSVGVKWLEEKEGFTRSEARYVQHLLFKFEKAGAEPYGGGKEKPGVQVSKKGISIYTNTGKNNSELFVNRAGKVEWSVNGQIDREYNNNRTSKEKLQMVTNARKSWDILLKGLDKGTVLSTNAYNGDDGGGSRVKAYEAMGFSKPRNNVPGNTQTGKVTELGFVPVGSNRNTKKSDNYTEFAEPPQDKVFITILFGTEFMN
jgi:hypothetical protein